jgi:5-methylcytosine-specific restriction endonuclease McrA
VEETKPLPGVFPATWKYVYQNMGVSAKEITEAARALSSSCWQPSCWKCDSRIDLNSGEGGEGFHVRDVTISEYLGLNYLNRNTGLKNQNYSPILSQKRRISPKIKQMAYEVFGNQCVACQRTARTLDHILAHAKGGLTEIDNLQPMCEECGTEKGDQDVEIVEVQLYCGLLPTIPNELIEADEQISI